MPNPPVARLQLGRALRRLREASGVSRDATAAELECDLSKISKVETGKATMQIAEVRALFELFGVGTDEREPILELARTARKRSTYRVPDYLRQYVGFEAESTELKTYQPEFVPGLLQTAAYTRAVTRAANPTRSPKEVERLVTTRQERQALLHTDDPPQLWVVCNEAVIKREVGGQDATAEQLERLLELGRLPHVSLQIMPFAAGAHAAMGTAFVILRLAEPPDTQVVYLEDAWDGSYEDGEQNVRAFVSAFDRLAAQAAGEDESNQMITRELERLR